VGRGAKGCSWKVAGATEADEAPCTGVAGEHCGWAQPLVGTSGRVGGGEEDRERPQRGAHRLAPRVLPVRLSGNPATIRRVSLTKGQARSLGFEPVSRSLRREHTGHERQHQ
jgi:hypothetical protein